MFLTLLIKSSKEHTYSSKRKTIVYTDSKTGYLCGYCRCHTVNHCIERVILFGYFTVCTSEIKSSILKLQN